MKRPEQPTSSDHTPRADSGICAADFEALRSLVSRLTGISIHEAKRGAVAAGLARRLRTLGLTSFAEYCALMSAEPPPADELGELIRCVTTNTTSFFREPHHFEFLRSTVFPELEQRAARGAPKRVRLWSAACSSGEEAYSLAMTALEHFGGRGWQIEVLATDIDAEVLARGELGVYAEGRVESLSGERRRRFLLRGRGVWEGHYQVRPQLRECVTFRQLNLLNAEWGIRAKFDAVFCRNVAIYFEPATQLTLFRRMHALLEEHACLMVGYAEDLAALSDQFAALPGTVYRARNASTTNPAAALPSRRRRSRSGAARPQRER